MAKTIEISPVARSIPYDDTVQTPLSGTADVQTMLDYLKNLVTVSASPGFTWGRSGTVSAGTYLLNDSVPSNQSGRTIFLNDAEIQKVFVANQDATSGIIIALYSHDGDGINLTLLGTVTTAATRSNVFDVSYSIAINKQLAVRIFTGSASAKNIVVGALIRGSI